MPRTILLTGPMGAGKSTLLSLPHRLRAHHLGTTAAIDTDLLSMMIDPTWELPDEERRYDLSGHQCWLLTRSFLTAGFETVLVGGNGWHTPDEGLNDMIGLLVTAGEVFHVTLDPSVEAVQRRVAARGGDVTPEALAEHVAWMRAKQRPWTCRIDNTDLTPEETLAELARRVGAGEGRITGPVAA